MENEFKKQDVDGNKLPEIIGKGLTGHWLMIEDEIRELRDDVMTFKLPLELKKAFMKEKNPSRILRAFVRGYVSQQKLKK
jgi:hypothetical protein